MCIRQVTQKKEKFQEKYLATYKKKGRPKEIGKKQQREANIKGEVGIKGEHRCLSTKQKHVSVPN